MKFLFHALILLFFSIVHAQTEVTIENFNTTDTLFKKLLLNNAAIAENDALQEEITDGVQPLLVTGKIDKNKAYSNWLAHAFAGKNQRAIKPLKQKFVGTVLRYNRNSKYNFPENSIGFDIVFNRNHYLLKNFKGLQVQKDIGKAAKKINYAAAPFKIDTNNFNRNLYQLHCIQTPPTHYRSQLHYLFYPTAVNHTLSNHPNIETENPTMGFYGTWCSNCTQNCEPELQPFEIVWWLKATENDPSPNKTWLVGIMHDGNKAFKQWSFTPMTASIAIPFAFNSDMEEGESFKIKAEHLVFDKFIDSEIKKLKVPTDALGCDEQYQPIHLIAGEKTFRLEFMLNNKLQTKALKYWFSQLNYDAKANIVSGYFNVSVAVEEVYTTRISFGKTLWQ